MSQTSGKPLPGSIHNSCTIVCCAITCQQHTVKKMACTIGTIGKATNHQTSNRLEIWWCEVGVEPQTSSQGETKKPELRDQHWKVLRQYRKASCWTLCSQHSFSKGS